MEISTLVVDANVAVWAVLPPIAVVDTMPFFLDWGMRQVRLIAPTFWAAECVSSIRRAVYSGQASVSQGTRAIDDLFDLGVETVSIDHHQCLAAFDWAARLRQAQAYDGFYLALAEGLGAPFWTADSRLANGARQIGVQWVHLIE